jgi:tetratricopeptide (TPR) repeat protein
MAQELWNAIPGMTEPTKPKKETPSWPTGILALCIDPTYGPALLTVGVLEYQHGRPAEAMHLFKQLLTLDLQTEPDLIIILDKAGTFLIDQNDLPRAQELYVAASQRFPEDHTLLAALAYTLARQGRPHDAIPLMRRVIALRPHDAELLNDLGFALMECGEFAESESVLTQAIAFANPNYKLPQGNLAELKRRMAGSHADLT